MNDAPQLLRVREVAKQLAVSEWLVWKWIKDGSLASIKAGKARRVTTEELWRFVERHQD